MAEFSLTLIQIIIICGILQGVLFSVLLFFRKTNFRANLMLSLFLFSLSFTLFTSLILDFGWYNQYPALHWLPFSLTFWLGPSFYFYIRFLTNANLTFRRKDLWHFTPVIFNYFHSIYHLVLGRSVPYPKLHNFTEALETYGILSLVIYFIFSLQIIRKYQHSILDTVSNLENITLRWLKEFILVLFVSLGLVFLFILWDFRLLVDFKVEYSGTVFFKYDDLVKFLNVFSLYWLGIRGYAQQGVFHYYQQEDTETEASRTPEDGKSYQETLALILQAMEREKLYLNPSLSLRMLEDHLNVPSREISRSLNLGLQKKFYYFINEYRVAEAKRRLSNPDFDHLSILAIAYDSGFNSKATFNRVFKELTGQSPSQFQKNKQ